MKRKKVKKETPQIIQKKVLPKVQILKKTVEEIDAAELLQQPDKNFDASKPLDDVRQELFTVIYTTNNLPHYWSNGQNSYEFAYGHTNRINTIEEEISELVNLKAKSKKERKGKTLSGIDREIAAKHDAITKIRRVCRASAPRLLARVGIKLRCNYLLDQLATNITVDRELTYLIQQRDDLGQKMGAIQHYDRREQRIRDKVDIKHSFDPVKSITIVEKVT